MLNLVLAQTFQQVLVLGRVFVPTAESGVLRLAIASMTQVRGGDALPSRRRRRAVGQPAIAPVGGEFLFRHRGWFPKRREYLLKAVVRGVKWLDMVGVRQIGFPGPGTLAGFPRAGR